MTNETFEQQTQILNDHRKGVFKAKGTHYANNGDRLENITNIANLAGVTRETACLTLAGKHIAALTDKAKKGEPVPTALRLELIGDIQNYFELLNGVMFERELASNNFGVEAEPKFKPEPPFKRILKFFDNTLKDLIKQYSPHITDMLIDDNEYMEVILNGIPTVFVNKKFSESGDFEIWQAEPEPEPKKKPQREIKPEPPYERLWNPKCGKIISVIEHDYPNEFNAVMHGALKCARLVIDNIPTIFIGYTYSESGVDEVWQAPAEPQKVTGKERKKILKALAKYHKDDYNNLLTGKLDSISMPYLPDDPTIYTIWLDIDEIVVTKD